MSDDKKELISFEDAVKRLPNGDTVHTFRAAGPLMLGADHGRDALLEQMRKAEFIEVTGPGAQAIHHGLAIWDDLGPLFIATKREES